MNLYLQFCLNSTQICFNAVMLYTTFPHVTLFLYDCCFVFYVSIWYYKRIKASSYTMYT